MNIPKNEKQFFFSKEGEITGHKYEGQFSVKCILSLADKRAVEIEQSRISVDLQNPTGNLQAISKIIANLRVRVISAPDWFNQAVGSLEILDDDVIFEVYSECLNKTKEWQDELKEKAQPQLKVEGN